MLRQWINNGKEAVFIMLLQLRRFITELKEAGRQGDSLFGGQSTTSRCPLADNAALLSSLSESARARRGGWCRPSFPAPGLCALCGWVNLAGFPSEVIAYLSLPFKLCFLKSCQPLALTFVRTKRGSFLQLSSPRHPVCPSCCVLIYKRRRVWVVVDVSAEASLEIDWILGQKAELFHSLGMRCDCRWEPESIPVTSCVL